MSEYSIHDLSGPLTLWYHGTTKENAESIMREGFRARTYFANALDSAIGFGGGYVFAVAFPKGTTSYSGWQFTIQEPIGPERIIGLKKYDVEVLYKDELAGQRVFESNMGGQLGDPGDCKQCGKSLKEMRWSDVYHRGFSSVELCSTACVETWEAAQEKSA